MPAYAFYRLPHAEEVVKVSQEEGEPEQLFSLSELNGREGFVVAPFEITTDHPILLIRPDKVESLRRSPSSSSHPSHISLSPSSSSSYAIDFANFHSQLQRGAFQKIVLSRCADEQLPDGLTPLDLFYRACELYPRMFISLVECEKSGIWLTASPEILLDWNGDCWHTIALAGTMKLEGEQLSGEGETVTWSTKNIQEQRFVTTYITECLEQFTGDFHEEGPYTARAANLVHLRSDFSFTLPDNDHLGELLHALHPTPAVCGLPKRDAFNFINRNEHTSRRYYSGFMGPLSLLPSRISLPGTHLYVSLRCMNIEGRTCHLFAGGGLLKDSTEEQEWLETEAKLETMRNLLG